MPDFWPSCGYRLLAVGADGRLTLTDDFLRATLLRPELAPVAESCAAELALHEKLLAAPRAAVGRRRARGDRRRRRPRELRGLAALPAAAHRRAVARGGVRRALPRRRRRAAAVRPPADADPAAAHPRRRRRPDARRAPPRCCSGRRRSRVTDDGAVMAADEATVELLATTGGFGSLGELLQQNRDAAAHASTSTRSTPRNAAVVLGARRAPRSRGEPQPRAPGARRRCAACWRSGSRTSSASR